MNKKERNAVIKQKTVWPSILAMAGAFLMIACIFLPYSTVNAERAEWIKQHPDTVMVEKLDLTAAEVKQVSLVQYARIYHAISEESWHDSTFGIFYIAFAALIGGSALIAALFSFGRKPIGAIFFGALSCGGFHIMNLDFTWRGVIPGQYYDWGMTHTLFPIAAGMLAIGAVWMLVKKLIVKKQLKAMPPMEVSN